MSSRSRRTSILAALVAILATVAAIVLTAPATGAATPTATSPKRIIKALSDGTTVATYQYGTSSPEDQVGDVYYDADWAPGTHPAIVVVHGGWWHNSYRTESTITQVAQKFFAAGFVVYNIDYRLAADQYRPDGSGTVNPGDRWPAQRIDTELAIQWLKTNAAQFGSSSTRVAAFGHSAGGHLVTLGAGFYNSVTVAASVGAVLQPHRTADIVLGYNTGDPSTPTMVKSFGYMTSTIGCSYEPTWSMCGGKWTSFKPETYYGANKPAIYAIKGENDGVEPVSALTATDYWLTKAGQEHKTVVAADRGHDLSSILSTNTADVQRWNDMVAYIKART
jgi:acetyl esterase/lipase